MKTTLFEKSNLEANLYIEATEESISIDFFHVKIE
jgi:hypothetical protein